MDTVDLQLEFPVRSVGEAVQIPGLCLFGGPVAEFSQQADLPDVLWPDPLGGIFGRTLSLPESAIGYAHILKGVVGAEARHVAVSLLCIQGARIVCPST